MATYEIDESKLSATGKVAFQKLLHEGTLCDCTGKSGPFHEILPTGGSWPRPTAEGGREASDTYFKISLDGLSRNEVEMLASLGAEQVDICCAEEPPLTEEECGWFAAAIIWDGGSSAIEATNQAIHRLDKLNAFNRRAVRALIERGKS